MFCHDYAIRSISARWRTDISTWTFRERIQLRCVSLLRVHRDSSFSANDVSAQSSELNGSWRRDVINITRKRDSARPSSRNVLSLQCVGLMQRRGKRSLVKFLVYGHIFRCTRNFTSSTREISTPRKEARLRRIEIASETALWNIQLSNWILHIEAAENFVATNWHTLRNLFFTINIT